MASKRIDFESGRDLQVDTCDRLKLARIKAGIEQDEMAEILGVSSSTISNWENGRTVPKGAFINAWAQITGFNKSSLIGTVDEDRKLAARAKVRAINSIAPGSSSVSQLPRLDSNQEPCGWVGPPLITAVTPLNVARPIKEPYVCSWPPEKMGVDGWYKNAGVSWYKNAGVSWTRRIPENTMALWAATC